EPNRASRCERAVALHQRAQVAALDVTHDQVEEAVRLARLVHGDDVGVVDRGREARLADEPLAVRGVLRVFAGDQLQCDAPLEVQLLGQVDDSHSPTAENGVEPAPGYNLPETPVFIHGAASAIEIRVTPVPSSTGRGVRVNGRCEDPQRWGPAARAFGA